MLTFSKCLFPDRIASVSKIFPTIMLYKLWEEGKVTSLDDPLERYAQNFVIKNPLGRLKDSEQRYTADGLVFLEKGSVPLKPSPVTLRRMASQLSGKAAPWASLVLSAPERHHRADHIPGVKKPAGRLFPSLDPALCTSQGSGRALESRVSAASWHAQGELLSRYLPGEGLRWGGFFSLQGEHRISSGKQIPFRWADSLSGERIPFRWADSLSGEQIPFRWADPFQVNRFLSPQYHDQKSGSNCTTAFCTPALSALIFLRCRVEGQISLLWIEGPWLLS